MPCSSAPAGAWADIIHLKNGRTIAADSVRENGNRYEYEIGEDNATPFRKLPSNGLMPRNVRH